MRVLKCLSVFFILLMVAMPAQAKWWIFGQANEEVQTRFVLLNDINYDELGDKVTLYRDSLPQGMVKIVGKAGISRGKVGGIRLSFDDRQTWQDAKFSDDGGFEFQFTPEINKTYVVFLEIMDTAGKTNDIEATRKEVTVSDQSMSNMVQQALDAMIAAYMAEDPARFMVNVDPDFAGDTTLLDFAIRKDFSSFDNLDLRYTINNLATDGHGNIHVIISYNRRVTSARSGETYTDAGVTEFTFRPGAALPRCFSMKQPLIFGLSDAANIATGTLWSTTNDPVLVIGADGSLTTLLFSQAVSGDNSYESGSITLVSEGHPPAGFNFASGEVSEGFYGNDFFITGGSDTPPAYAFGSLATGVTLIDLGMGGIGTLTEAPDMGYTTPFDLELTDGHSYAFKLANGKYALLEVRSVSINWVMGVAHVTLRFDYKYQPDGSRTF